MDASTFSSRGNLAVQRPVAGDVTYEPHTATKDRLETAGGPVFDAKSLEARAAAAVAESETKELASRYRVDSIQDAAPNSPPENNRSRRELQSPLRLYTKAQPSTAPLELPGPCSADPKGHHRSLAPVAQACNSAPPPLAQATSPTWDANSTSPHKERLPSFRQLTGQLSELAEAAATQEARGSFSHHPTLSFGSNTSQSPRLPYHSPFSQTSPTTHYAPLTARSPATSVADSHAFGSPQQFTPVSFCHRRNSNSADHAPPLPPSLPSTSSGESHGNSGGETGSTTQTTPVEIVPGSDGQARATLPPVPTMAPISGLLNVGYQCDYPDCTAQPFQTQYLLSSHKNVHSQNRPHYCPVKDCPRSEGGKGFKRKNEMIRHGLVHNSPGYVCPFCPDREHKYPRPDNLQRHVRVHHVDRDKDDPLLREVLAQRAEGIGKTRRRRTLTASSSGAPPVISTDEHS